MNKLKAIIIDDEPRACGMLQLLLERHVPEVERIWVCTDARQAAALIHERQPDLVFLDIQMPHLDGFAVLEQLRSRRFRVIFTTAFSEHALQAIRFGAFDYLLKPIDPAELVAAVQRYLSSLGELIFQPELLRNALQNLQAASPGEFRLAVPTKEGVHFFSPAEIMRLEALGSYTEIHLGGGRRFLASKGLGEYEEILAGHGFLRTHKSHLVNKLSIAFLHHEGYLVLREGERVEVSRRRKEEVMQALRG